MILLVTYDLKKPGKDYTALYNLLKTAPSWWHYLESTWLVSTNDSANAWADRIRTVIDQNDRFLVVEITHQSRQGWLPTDAWEWIKNHE